MVHGIIPFLQRDPYNGDLVRNIGLTAIQPGVRVQVSQSGRLFHRILEPV